LVGLPFVIGLALFGIWYARAGFRRPAGG